jgi:hypothetical protein
MKYIPRNKAPQKNSQKKAPLKVFCSKFQHITAYNQQKVMK